MIFRILIFLCTISLVGCSSAVSSYISSQQSFGYNQISSSDTLIQQGFFKSEFCSIAIGSCLSYLEATPMTDKKRLSYQVTIQANGKEESSRLEIERKDTNFYSGLVVLIHGFRASKEYMVNSALYFRFLGFDVIVPDLLGHGESSPGVRFGIEDSDVLSELLDTLEVSGNPIFVVGNSLGAVAATRLLSLRNDIDGLVLQAPMVVFDQAVVNYANAYSPFYSSFIPDSSMRTGAVKALKDAGVSLEQTNIVSTLPNGKRPVLILVSNTDPVAPPYSYTPISSEWISVVEVSGRSHPSMSVINQQDNEVIQNWLSNTVLQRKSR
jgi:pimeloyl-ACP methyl ester carboxylesterase